MFKQKRAQKEQAAFEARYERARRDRVLFGQMFNSDQNDDHAPWVFTNNMGFRSLWRMAAPHTQSHERGGKLPHHYKLLAHFQTLQSDVEDTLFNFLQSPESYNLEAVSASYLRTRKELVKLNEAAWAAEKVSSDQEIIDKFGVLLQHALEQVGAPEGKS